MINFWKHTEKIILFIGVAVINLFIFETAVTIIPVRYNSEVLMPKNLFQTLLDASASKIKESLEETRGVKIEDKELIANVPGFQIINLLDEIAADLNKEKDKFVHLDLTFENLHTSLKGLEKGNINDLEEKINKLDCLISDGSYLDSAQGELKAKVKATKQLLGQIKKNFNQKKQGADKLDINFWNDVRRRLIDLVGGDEKEAAYAALILNALIDKDENVKSVEEKKSTKREKSRQSGKRGVNRR